jgi:predicted ATP-grasp superfamily ATP-dependent carboligase
VQAVTRLEPALCSAQAWPSNLNLVAGRPGLAAEEDDLRRLASQVDYTLLIAPEFGDVLATRCRWVEEVGGRLLGPSADAVRLTADKLRLAEHLRRRAVPTPPTVPWSPQAATLGFPLVVKPRDGAGSQATRLVRDRNELDACSRLADEEGWQGELIVQPFLPGVHASVSFLVGPGGKFCLKPAWQHLSMDGRFRYLGGGLPLPRELAAAAKMTALRALNTVEGLRGWFGMDVVLGPKGPFLIEINPRLTTSIVGLRRLAKFNLMDALLAVAAGTSLPLMEWAEGCVYFQPDGTVAECETPEVTFPNLLAPDIGAR